MVQPGLTFDETNHVYRLNGEVLPSVTQVLSSVGTRKGAEFWKAIGSSDFACDETASAFGTTFHKIASIIIAGGIPEYPEVMEPWVKQFNRFRRDNKFVPLYDIDVQQLVEYPMAHTIWRYAGTPDLVAYDKRGDVFVVDWKTSTAKQHHWGYQTAGYAELVKHVFKIKKKIFRLTVRFDPDNYHLIAQNDPIDSIVFQSACNLYRLAA